MRMAASCAHPLQVRWEPRGAWIGSLLAIMCPSWQGAYRGDRRAFGWQVRRLRGGVSVVGTSGAGKSTFASSLALVLGAAVLGAAFLEPDAEHHQAGWTPLPAAKFRALAGTDGP
jgi:hypothetical protein